jgi:hypothetical protein
LDAFLWENGSIVDLNTLIPSSSGFYLWTAEFIADNGEIAALGFLRNGDSHVVQLIPCDENHPNFEGCDYSPVEVSAVAASRTTEATPQQQLTPQEISRIRALLMNRHRGFMPGTMH